MKNFRTRRVCVRVVTGSSRSRQGLLRTVTGLSGRRPERDGVPCRDKIATGSCVAIGSCVTTALRTRPIGPLRSQCGGVFLFGPEPNGPPLEKMGKTNAGVDESLQKPELDQGAQ
ncbi:hypothetical protein Taro_007432 [Colocasia esculenta]|uniref:Uncharacterized protein n=1 Tax=Colocasia esculenta TaxID=4460 RepID=A0A843U0D7_COLES|nr:hypothetical protein [Colocasia esculenta]